MLAKLTQLPFSYFHMLLAVGSPQAGLTGAPGRPVSTQEIVAHSTDTGFPERFRLGARAVREVVAALETMGLVETWHDSRSATAASNRCGLRSTPPRSTPPSPRSSPSTRSRPSRPTNRIRTHDDTPVLPDFSLEFVLHSIKFIFSGNEYRLQIVDCKSFCPNRGMRGRIWLWKVAVCWYRRLCFSGVEKQCQLRQQLLKGVLTTEKLGVATATGASS